MQFAQTNLPHLQPTLINIYSEIERNWATANIQKKTQTTLHQFFTAPKWSKKVLLFIIYFGTHLCKLTTCLCWPLFQERSVVNLDRFHCIWLKITIFSDQKESSLRFLHVRVVPVIKHFPGGSSSIVLWKETEGQCLNWPEIYRCLFRSSQNLVLSHIAHGTSIYGNSHISSYWDSASLDSSVTSTPSVKILCP